MTPPSVRIHEAQLRELWHSLRESRVLDVLHTPLWLVALVAAAAAPFVAGALHASLLSARKRRTAAAVSRALAAIAPRASLAPGRSGPGSEQGRA